MEISEPQKQPITELQIKNSHQTEDEMYPLIFLSWTEGNSEFMDLVSQNKNKIEAEEKNVEDFILKTPEGRLLIKRSSDIYKTVREKLPCSVGNFIKSIDQKLLERPFKTFLPIKRLETFSVLKNQGEQSPWFLSPSSITVLRMRCVNVCGLGLLWSKITCSMISGHLIWMWLLLVKQGSPENTL